MTPFELLIDQIKECFKFTDTGQQPFMTEQIINTAHTYLFNIGSFFDSCKTWNNKPVNEKTLENLKSHFLEAQTQLHQQQQLMQQAGYQTNNINTVNNKHSTLPGSH